VESIFMPVGAITSQTGAQTYLEVLCMAEDKTKAEQWADAAPLWAQVVALNPVNGTFWLQLGLTHYHAQHYREAIGALVQALELGTAFPSPSAYEYSFPWRVAYEIARCYAMLGERDPALNWLEQAWSMGWRAQNAIQTDEALILLRDDPRLKDLVGLADVDTLARDEGWRYDLAFLAREIKRLHYAPFRHMHQQMFDAVVQQLHDTIPHLSDPQLFVEIMKLVRRLGDGHSSVVFWQERPEFRAVPMTFYLFTEGVFSTAAAAAYAEWVGMQIIMVGEHPIDDVLTALDQIISHGPSFWRHSFCSSRISCTVWGSFLILVLYRLPCVLPMVACIRSCFLPRSTRSSTSSASVCRRAGPASHNERLAHRHSTYRTPGTIGLSTYRTTKRFISSTNGCGKNPTTRSGPSASGSSPLSTTTKSRS
jgi:hypothetical protein